MPTKRGKALPLAIAGFVLVAGLGAGAYFLFLRKDGKAETPADAIRGFYEAVGAGDCEKAGTFVAPSFVSAEDVCSELASIKEDIGTLGRIVSTDLQGTTAYVVAERTVAGVADQRVITVENGAETGWQVAGGSACYGEEAPEDLGNEHLESGAIYDGYNSTPPTSGPHDPTPTETGVMFEEPQPVEQVVHAMEHGAVVFWVNPSVSAGLQEHAQELVNDAFAQGYESLVYTPYEGMNVPFAMTAWGSLQQCVGFDADEVQTFVDAHYGQGLEGSLACFGSAESLPACIV